VENTSLIGGEEKLGKKNSSLGNIDGFYIREGVRLRVSVRMKI